MDKPKIAFVVQRNGKEVNGGAEYHCFLVAKLMKDIWDVEILTTCALDYMTWDNYYSEGVEIVDGVSIRRFNVDIPRNIENFNQYSSEILPNTKEASLADSEKWMNLQGPVSNSLLNYVKENFDNKEIFKISKEILIYISLNYNINFKKGKNLYTEVTHTLLVSKLYYKYFGIRDKKLNDNFYHSLSSYFNDNSDFWLQYARMEMKLKDFDSAKIHLEQASTLNPSSYKIQHTIGQWHMFYSCTLSNYNLAKEEFEKGEKIMNAQITINDAYPVHSYIDGFMLLHKKFNFELESKKIRYLYSIIMESLKRFNNHALLLIIWKKFYKFLEINKKLHIIKTSLEDKIMLDSIDTSKDAEEQYII